MLGGGGPWRSNVQVVVAKGKSGFLGSPPSGANVSLSETAMTKTKCVGGRQHLITCISGDKIVHMIKRWFIGSLSFLVIFIYWFHNLFTEKKNGTYSFNCSIKPCFSYHFSLGHDATLVNLRKKKKINLDWQLNWLERVLLKKSYQEKTQRHCKRIQLRIIWDVGTKMILFKKLRIG